MTRNPFTKKLTAIRYRHGDKATEYFSTHPACEQCSEKRIAVLNIHHKHGKAVEEFETLCFNCHMIFHANVAGEFTYEDHLRRLQLKAAKILQKDAERIAVWQETKSLRESGKRLGVSHNTIRNTLIRNGIAIPEPIL